MNTSLGRIESYLNTLGILNEQVSEDVWLLNDQSKGLNHIIVFVDETLVTLRCRMFELPKIDQHSRAELFESLLRLNLEMVHGAYALEEDTVVLMDTLELETMDLEEFQASIEALGLAIAQHYPLLANYRQS